MAAEPPACSAFTDSALLRVDGVSIDDEENNDYKNFFIKGFEWGDNSCGLDCLAHLAIILGVGQTVFDEKHWKHPKSTEELFLELLKTHSGYRLKRHGATAKAFLMPHYFALASTESDIPLYHPGDNTPMLKVWQTFEHLIPQTSVRGFVRTWCKECNHPSSLRQRSAQTLGSSSYSSDFEAGLPEPSGAYTDLVKWTAHFATTRTNVACKNPKCKAKLVRAFHVLDHMPPRLAVVPPEVAKEIDITKISSITSLVPRGPLDVLEKFVPVVTKYRFKAGVLCSGKHYTVYWVDGADRRLYCYDGMQPGGVAKLVRALPKRGVWTILFYDAVLQGNKVSILHSSVRKHARDDEDDDSDGGRTLKRKLIPKTGTSPEKPILL